MLYDVDAARFRSERLKCTVDLHGRCTLERPVRNLPFHRTTKPHYRCSMRSPLSTHCAHAVSYCRRCPSVRRKPTSVARSRDVTTELSRHDFDDEIISFFCSRDVSAAAADGHLRATVKWSGGCGAGGKTGRDATRHQLVFLPTVCWYSLHGGGRRT